MKAGMVTGHIVSTIKTASHNHCKLLVVNPVDSEGRPYDADPIIAVDVFQAGIGDIVLVVENGESARELLNKPDAAIDAVIAGIVDRLNVD